MSYETNVIKWFTTDRPTRPTRPTRQSRPIRPTRPTDRSTRPNDQPTDRPTDRSINRPTFLTTDGRTDRLESFVISADQHRPYLHRISTNHVRTIIFASDPCTTTPAKLTAESWPPNDRVPSLPAIALQRRYNKPERGSAARQIEFFSDQIPVRSKKKQHQIDFLYNTAHVTNS